jgi:hypothetical protein
MQIYAIYDYQVAFGVRLATENPYVPTFGADIPGGPPGLGVSSQSGCWVHGEGHSLVCETGNSYCDESM